MRRGLWRALLSVLVLAAARPLAAQDISDYDYENLSFRGAGPTWGYVWPTKVRATPVYGVRADLGYLGPHVRIVPNLSYWRSTMRDRELANFAARISAIPALQSRDVALTAADLAPVHWSDVALDLDGQWVVNTPTGVLAYAGAGLGVHFMRGSGAAIENTFVQDLLNNVSPALTGLAGLEYRVANRVQLFGEARLTAMGDVQFGSLRAGLSIMMPGAQQAPPAGQSAPSLPPSRSDR